MYKVLGTMYQVGIAITLKILILFYDLIQLIRALYLVLGTF